MSLIKKSPSFISGFTLVELLTVIVLIAILLSAAGMSARKAREVAKAAKAESECRELVNAVLEYRSLYEKWPGHAKDEKVQIEEPVTAEFLKPLSDAGANDRGIVFLNVNLSGGVFVDPWKNPYMIYIHDEQKDVSRGIELETCVSFPYRRKIAQNSTEN